MLVEPVFKWREIVGEGGGVHFFLAGEDFEGVGPGLALAEGKHLIEFFAGGFVVVDGAAVERTFERRRFCRGRDGIGTGRWRARK